MAARRQILNSLPKQFTSLLPTHLYFHQSFLSSSHQTIPSSSTSTSNNLTVDKILLNLKLGKSNYFHKSSNLYHSITPLDIAHVLYQCRENLHLGLKFIDLLLFNFPNFRHSTLSFCVMVHFLVRGRRVSNAQALILKMVRKSGVSRVEIVDSLVGSFDQCGSNLGVFDLLIRTYVQAKRLREAAEVFELLISTGICVSINACNSVLGGLVKVGWVDLAWEIYHRIVKFGVQVNAFTLNIMVNGLCKDGKMEKVKSFLLEMEGNGVFADNVTYNTLINAYCKEGNVEKALELMN